MADVDVLRRSDGGRAATARLAAVTAPGPQEAPRRAPLRVVPSEPAVTRQRSPLALRRRRLLLRIGAGLLLALSLLALVSVHVLLTEGQFKLQKLQSDAAEKEARYQQLRLQVAQLEAPQRVVNEAQRRGMVQPPAITYLTPTPQSTATTAPATAGQHQATSGGDATGATSWSTVKPKLDGRP